MDHQISFLTKKKSERQWHILFGIIIKWSLIGECRLSIPLTHSATSENINTGMRKADMEEGKAILCYHMFQSSHARDHCLLERKPWSTLPSSWRLLPGSSQNFQSLGISLTDRRLVCSGIMGTCKWGDSCGKTPRAPETKDLAEPCYPVSFVCLSCSFAVPGLVLPAFLMLGKCL